MSRLFAKGEPDEKLFRVVFDSVAYHVQAKNMGEAIEIWQRHLIEVHGPDAATDRPDEVAIVDDAPVLRLTAKCQRSVVACIVDVSRSDAMALKAASDEIQKARGSHAPMQSVHEAYAVILEELDEFWEEVRKKKADRSTANMSKELTQIAAMALRAKVDLNLVE